MSRSKKELAQMTQLGSQSTRYVYDYDPSLLERFSNKHPSDDYMVMLNCPEFTSARKQASPISRKSASRIFLTNILSNLSR